MSIARPRKSNRADTQGSDQLGRSYVLDTRKNMGQSGSLRRGNADRVRRRAVLRTANPTSSCLLSDTNGNYRTNGSESPDFWESL